MRFKKEHIVCQLTFNRSLLIRVLPSNQDSSELVLLVVIVRFGLQSPFIRKPPNNFLEFKCYKTITLPYLMPC